METGRSTSGNMSKDPEPEITHKLQKYVHWEDEEMQYTEEEKQQGAESYGVLGQEDVYFFGETGGWVTEKIGKPKWRVVAPEELWRWSKERLELMVSGKRRSESLEGRDTRKNSSREKELEERGIAEFGSKHDGVSTEVILKYLKRKVAGDMFGACRPTVYNLCQQFYEEIIGYTHSQQSCRIDRCVLCRCDQISRGEEAEPHSTGWSTGESDCGEGLETGIGILEAGEVEMEKRKIIAPSEVEQGADTLDEIFGQEGGYPTKRRPFHSRREVDIISPAGTVDEWYLRSGIQLGTYAVGSLLTEAK